MISSTQKTADSNNKERDRPAYIFYHKCQCEGSRYLKINLFVTSHFRNVRFPHSNLLILF